MQLFSDDFLVKIVYNNYCETFQQKQPSFLESAGKIYPQSYSCIHDTHVADSCCEQKYLQDTVNK